MNRGVLFVFGLAVFVFFIGLVSAIPITGCMTIDSPGNYELMNDISYGGASSDCIQIRSKDVLLNGNGYKITLTSSIASNPIGIYYDYVRLSNIYNLTIKNLIVNSSATPTSMAVKFTRSLSNYYPPRHEGMTFVNVTFISRQYGFGWSDNAPYNLSGLNIINSTFVSILNGSGGVNLGSPSYQVVYDNIIFDNVVFTASNLNSVVFSAQSAQTGKISFINRLPTQRVYFNGLFYFENRSIGSVESLSSVGSYSSLVDVVGLNSVYVISRNRAYMNSSASVSLRVPYRITLHGITGVTTPQINRNGVMCSPIDCQLESFNGGTAVFRVNDLGDYNIVNYAGGSGGGGACPNPDSCGSDYDCNGAFGVPDIFAFLSDWFAQTC